MLYRISHNHEQLMYVGLCDLLLILNFVIKIIFCDFVNLYIFVSILSNITKWFVLQALNLTN